eukprot:8257646-Pyramimonas_sp.AAC.1
MPGAHATGISGNGGRPITSDWTGLGIHGGPSALCRSPFARVWELVHGRPGFAAEPWPSGEENYAHASILARPILGPGS